MSFSRRVSSTWTLTVALLQGKLADATGSRSGSTACPPRALSHGHQGSTAVTHVICR